MGIPIGLDYSWFLVFALLTWVFAAAYYPAEFRGWGAGQYWSIAALTSVVFFASVLLHELGHSVVARRYGVRVRRITLFIFGGVAEMESEPPTATAEFWIAIAGPIVSFLLAGLFQVFAQASASVEPALALGKYMAYLNGTLALFNLIPGFPLDGGRVFRAIVWGASHNFHRATLIAANVGRFIAFLFILLGVWLVLEGNLGAGLWIAFIGWFLESAAAAQVHQEVFQNLLAGHSVYEVMNKAYADVSPGTTLHQIVQHHVIGGGVRSFVVKDGSNPLGLLTLGKIKAVPPDEWPTTTAAQAMVPLTQLRSISPQAGIWTLLKEMTSEDLDQVPVMANGDILGIVSKESISTYFRTLEELRLGDR